VEYALAPVALLLLIPIVDLDAQRPAPTASFARGSVSSRAPDSTAGLGGTILAPFVSRVPGDSAAPSTLWAVLAAAAVPGAGQAILRQDRFVVYMAVEAFGWARYLTDLREGRRQRNSYRGLAREVARADFAIVRPTGDFDYYERMEHFVESGAFDVVPGGSLDPESDETTFNGSIWLLARQTYWEDPAVAPDRGSPAYVLAEEFYRRRAVSDAFRWSWRDAELEYDEFRRTIRQSNEAYRNSLAALGVIIANHALSTVDAFVTVRLRRRSGASQLYDLTASFPIGGPRRRLGRD